jgi:hypothetical protein
MLHEVCAIGLEAQAQQSGEQPYTKMSQSNSGPSRDEVVDAFPPGAQKGNEANYIRRSAPLRARPLCQPFVSGDSVEMF